MPAQLSFFDMEASVTPPVGYFPPIPITAGPNWQPGDIRVYCLGWHSVTTAAGVDNAWIPIPGYTSVNVQFDTGSGLSPVIRWGVFWRRMVTGDLDTFFNFVAKYSLQVCHSAIFTVRGVDPTSTPTITTWQITGTGSTVSPPATIVVSSVTVPSAGTTAVWVSNGAYQTTAGVDTSTGTPPGWTNLAATTNSGATYNPYDTSPSSIVVAKSFSSSGSTGAVNFPIGNSVNPVGLVGATVFFKPAADVSATAGSASTTATATSATFSTSTAVTVTTGSASTTATATTAFNPLQGFWVSDALALSGSPVTGSVVRLASRTPAGTTCVVETSLNGGASWDLATNNRSIPRLLEGDTATQTVIARVTLTRANASDPPPRVLSLELQVSSDSGVDELVAIGHGMIDKVTVKAVGGTTGSGSSTSVATSTGVVSRGGGQTGSGTSIKVHAVDLSLSIKRNVWQMPFTVPGGMNYGDAVQAMVKDRLPSQTDFSIASTTTVLPEIVVFGLQQGGDPWQDIQDLATAIGYECFFDPRGVFTFRPVPDPRQGVPVWVFDENSNPTVVEVSRELSDEQTFNHIIVVGQSSSSSNPVTAEAFDNDPSSQTYILGDYGEVTQRLTFPLVITQDQAQATANALLFNSLGAADTVTITNVPMPALEPGDIVKIVCSEVKANGTYMINSMTTSLSPADPQQLVCFRQSTNT